MIYNFHLTHHIFSHFLFVITFLMPNFANAKHILT